MKVAFAIASLRSGGAERVITNLANLFSDHGHQVTLFVFDRGEPFYPINSNVNTRFIHPFTPGNIFETTIFLFRVIFILKNNLKEIRPDGLISFLTLTNVICIIAGKMSGTHVFISERIGLDHREKKLVEAGRKFLYRFASGIVFQTQRIIDAYREHKISLPKNIAIIRNPLPAAFLTTTEVIQRTKIILGVGRLEKQKGFDILIKAFSKISNGHQDWQLHIVGDGREKSSLKALSESLGSDHVVFRSSAKNIKTIYEKSSIFVLSSRFEGFPNVLCEAMASGCACISFDCNYGPAEIITHGNNGLLAPPEDEEALANYLEILINDTALRTKLSNGALQIRRNLEPSVIFKQWENLLKRSLTHVKWD